MQGRFQRGGKHCISPFFAFQDIITSAIAILIVVVMLLALSLKPAAVPDAADPVAVELQKQLQAVLDELDRTNAEVRRLQQLALDIKDPTVMKGNIESLRRELADLQAQNQARQSQLRNLKANDASTAVWAEIDKKKAAVTDLAKQLAALQSDAAKSLAEMNRLEALAKDREAQLLAEKAKKNQIWLIPDRPDSSKEPLLVTVSDKEITIQRFDKPEKEAITGWRTSREFEKALSHYSKLDQYVVFYFKPSGTEKFDALTTAAKDAGFDIGYDAIGEEMEINFTPMR